MKQLIREGETVALTIDHPKLGRFDVHIRVDDIRISFPNGLSIFHDFIKDYNTITEIDKAYSDVVKVVKVVKGEV